MVMVNEGNIETYNEYTTRVRKRRQWRNTIAILFPIITITIAFMAILLGNGNTEYVMTIPIVAVSGSVIVLLTLAYPYLRPLNPPRYPDVNLVAPQKPESLYYYEVIHNKLLYYLTLPFFIGEIAFAGWSFYQGETLAAIVLTAAGFFFLLILVAFDHISIRIDNSSMDISLGPIKTTIPISDIETIRPVSIDWWGDYLGFGKRISPDGTIGVISTIRTGARIELKSGKTYEVSSNDPQALVNFVRFQRQPET